MAFSYRKREREYVMKQDVAELDLRQTIRLLAQLKLFEIIPEMQPLFAPVVITACAARWIVKAGQRRNVGEEIRELYTHLQQLFLRQVRAIAAEGHERVLAKLKPIVKKHLQVDAKWLLFRCPADDGTVYHVQV
jgi:hypothetical protein